MSSSKNKWRAECIKGFPVVSHRAEKTAVRELLGWLLLLLPLAIASWLISLQAYPSALSLFFLCCQLLTENRTQPITLRWVYPVSVYPPNSSCSEIILLKICYVVRSPIIKCWVCFTGVKNTWILCIKV